MDNEQKQSRIFMKEEAIKRMLKLGYESLAAVGSIVTDLVEMSNGKLDVENFVAAIRGVHYNGF